jgi:hypothetical protein
MTHIKEPDRLTFLCYSKQLIGFKHFRAVRLIASNTNISTLLLKRYWVKPENNLGISCLNKLWIPHPKAGTFLGYSRSVTAPCLENIQNHPLT